MDTCEKPIVIVFIFASGQFCRKMKESHIETERKFLVKDNSYKETATESHRMTQGYICRESGRTVRVRISGGKAWLTIKGASSGSGMSRYEWEREIPAEEAEELMKLCQEGTVDKTRHIVPYEGHRFEVDEFHGENRGLVIAEVELENETEPFGKPAWLGKEVTGDRRYYNSMLTLHPFSEWGCTAREQAE